MFKVHDDLVQQVVPVVRKMRKGGLNLKPKTKKAKQELLNKVALGTWIRNEAILQEAVGLVAEEK